MPPGKLRSRKAKSSVSILDSNNFTRPSRKRSNSSLLTQGKRPPPQANCSRITKVAASGTVAKPLLANSLITDVLPEYAPPSITYFLAIFKNYNRSEEHTSELQSH